MSAPNPHPHTAGRPESPRAIRTNGVGIRCMTYLNLTKSLADVDERRTKEKVWRELRRARKDAQLAAQVAE